MHLTEETQKKDITLNSKSIPNNWDGLNLEQFGWEQFQRGEAYQKQKDQEDFENSLSKNLNKAATLSESIFHTANNDYFVHITKAYLKLETIHQYETLFLVDKKDFLSDKLREVYQKSHSIKADFNCDDFYISFKFMPFSEDLNLDSLHSDGFTLVYNSERRKQQKPVTRKA